MTTSTRARRSRRSRRGWWRGGTNLVETLKAWLDAFGDVARAAEAMYVHPNTFRYRLRRLAEVGEIDLDDPDQRFVAMLQLRVLGPFADD